MNDADAWQQVADAMAVDSRRLARLRQVHGSTAAIHRRGAAASADGVYPEADIVITDDPEVALVVQTADCVPIVIRDRRLGVAAAVHAGWRGLAAHVPLKAVRRMTEDFGSRAEDLVVAIGPAIGPCCYEVGPDVRTQFEEASFTSGELNRWFSASPIVSEFNPAMRALSPIRRDGHWFFAPSQSARDQLLSAGVSGLWMFDSGLCTASHLDVFCSYRRDGPPAGRMAAAVRLQGSD